VLRQWLTSYDVDDEGWGPVADAHDARRESYSQSPYGHWLSGLGTEVGTFLAFGLFVSALAALIVVLLRG
jgi:hypothetical protein